MQSPRRSLARFPLSKGVTPRGYTATLRVCELAADGASSPEMQGGADRTRPPMRGEGRSLASSGAAGPGHFSPFFHLRPPPFVLLIEFFSFASRRRPRYVQKSSVGYDVAERSGGHEEKSAAVNYRAPNLKYIPVYRLIQPSDVTFFSFAG